MENVGLANEKMTSTTNQGGELNEGFSPIQQSSPITMSPAKLDEWYDGSVR